jgi:HEAT repeat protein
LVAISGLASSAEPAALSRVCEVAGSDPEPSVRNAAIELLADNPGPAATSALIGLLASDAHRMRALNALSRGAVARKEQLAAALQVAPAEIAEALVTVITSMPQAVSEPLLLRALETPNEHARRAATRALRFAFASEQVTQALAFAASHDSDPEVRRVAAARLS